MRRDAALSPRATKRRIAALAAVAAGAVAAQLAGATAGWSAASAPASSEAARPHVTRVIQPTWLALSGGVGNSIQPAVGRFGTALQVAWVQSGGAQDALDTSVLSPSGSLVSGPTTVVKADALDSYPTLFADSGRRYLSFAGIDASPTTNTQGYQVVATSTDGATWTLPGQALSTSDYAYASYGSDTVETSGGPVQVYTAGSASAVSWHAGFSAIPSTSGPDNLTADTGDYAYQSGVGFDPATQSTYVAWFSNSGGTTTEGIQAQQILPSEGSVMQAPDSVVQDSTGYNAIEPLNRVDVASRPADAGGGSYIGYAVGYPGASKVALWRIGSATPLVVGGGRDVDAVDVAPATGGRLYLFWHSSSSSVIHVARTNPAATAIGTSCSIATPGNTDSAFAMAGDGSLGPLQLVVDAGSTTQRVWSTVIRPCLHVTASPSSVSNTSKHKVTVTVGDAGAPVSGAKVHFGDTSEATNAQGRAVFTVAKGVRKQTITVTVTAKGYEPATTKVKVT